MTNAQGRNAQGMTNVQWPMPRRAAKAGRGENAPKRNFALGTHEPDGERRGWAPLSGSPRSFLAGRERNAARSPRPTGSGRRRKAPRRTKLRPWGRQKRLGRRNSVLEHANGISTDVISARLYKNETVGRRAEGGLYKKRQLRLPQSCRGRRQEIVSKL